MGELNGNLVPDGPAEVELIQRLYAVTAEAQEAGVETETIVASLSFAAASIAMYADEEIEMPDPSAERQTKHCPNCGDLIDGVTWEMGGVAHLDPCECQIDQSLLEGWSR